MLQRGLLASLVLLLLLPALAAAQKVELTPFVGFRFGGQLDDDFPPAPADFELDESSSAGIILGFAVTRGFRVELTWTHQTTDLLDDRLFFEEVELFEIDVDYYLAGATYQWTLGQVRPFVGFGIGAAELDPGAPGLASETRLAVSLGGGVKLMLTQNFGFRLEGRLLAIEINDGGRCHDCHHYDDDNELTQGELRGGLIFAF